MQLTDWCVVYRPKNGLLLDVEVFCCKAESYDHAEEQAENACPDDDILWLSETDSAKEAIQLWLTCDGDIEND